MTVSWTENPRVRGSIPRLATSNTKQRAHSSEWAFCYVAFVMGRGGVGFSKYSMLVLLAVVLIALLWRFGRAVFTGVTKWLLWALGAVCVCTGLVFLVTSEGKPLPIVGGFRRARIDSSELQPALTCCLT